MSDVILRPADYIVTILILLVPLGIGIVFAIKDAKKMTRLEYLLGGQRMTMLPVALSMFATYQSAISLIGIPSEVYMYGSAVFVYFIGFSLSFIACYGTFIPLMYPLEVTSVFEYLNLRFRSQAVRLLSTVIAILQTIFFMALVLLAPALALQAAADMPMWMSVLLIGFTGTVYTVIGGIKSVIWTDAFQSVIMFVGLLAMIIRGSVLVGSFTKAWSIGSEGGRVLFDKYNPDPRIRMSWLGALSGGFCAWISTSFSQSTLQRVRSMKNLRSAKMSFLVNIPLILAYGFLLVTTGLVTFAYFSHVRCDPLKAHKIMNPNQVTPFFVLQIMSEIPGMAGLYMAMLFCGTLSSFSSGINALAANTVEDILERPLKNTSERTATNVTKVAVAIYGVFVCFLAFVAQYLRGPVSQMVASTAAPLSTITAGMFLIGCMVPWANKYGALAGGIVSFIITTWMILGAIFYGKRPKSLPLAPIDMCDANNSTLLTGKSGYVMNVTSAINNVSHIPPRHFPIPSNSSDLSSIPFSFYDISYEWYAVVSLVICIGVGLVVSYLTKSKCQELSSAEAHLMFPFCRRFISVDKPDDTNCIHVESDCNEKYPMAQQKHVG